MAREIHTTEDGTPVGTRFLVTVKGKLIAWQGSPRSDGSFWTQSGYPPDENVPQVARLGAMLSKQQALRGLFASEGQVFEVVGLDGQVTMSCNPRLAGPVVFEEGPWHTECHYTVQLEADSLATVNPPAGELALQNYHVKSASQNWDFEPADELGRTYRLSHQISAVGVRVYQANGSLLKPAWQCAQDYVNGALGLGLDPSQVAGGLVNDAGLGAYNYLRAQQVGELAGTYQVTETWLCFNPANQPDSYGGTAIPAIEEFTVTTRQSVQDGLTYVDLEGSIRGLEQRDNSSHVLATTRWANAYAKWQTVFPNLLARAEAVSGWALNPVALSTSASSNEVAGTVSYHYSWNNRALSVIAGALTEVIATTTDRPAEVFAALTVIGRPLGPVVQDLLTITPKFFAVSIEAQLPAASLTAASVQPDTDLFVAGFAPPGSLVANDVESWSSRSGRYTRQTRYVYE